MALQCAFRGFWFKSLNTHPYLFLCNISLFGNIFAHFLAVSKKNKTFEKNFKSPKKRVAMRFARKKRITFAWYTKVIPYVYVYYQKVLCYKVCATKRYIFCRFCRSYFNNSTLLDFAIFCAILRARFTRNQAQRF